MSKSKEQELWEACTNGELETVIALTADPSVDVNWADPDLGRTPFYRASGHGKAAVVEFLLKDPRVDVNKQQQTEGVEADLHRRGMLAEKRETVGHVFYERCRGDTEERRREESARHHMGRARG